MFIYAVQHGVHGFGAGAFKPTWFVFLAAAPILMFNYEGFELPSNAAEEMTNPQRDVPFAVLRSGIGTVLFYGVPFLAILLVRPPRTGDECGWIRRCHEDGLRCLWRACNEFRGRPHRRGQDPG